MNVKICGITKKEDARKSSELGAWALGFIFYKKSPRFVDYSKAKEIISYIREEYPGPEKFVGVFVNESVDLINEIAEQVGLTTVQLVGVRLLRSAAGVRACGVRVRACRGRSHVRYRRAVAAVLASVVL